MADPEGVSPEVGSRVKLNLSGRDVTARIVEDRGSLGGHALLRVRLEWANAGGPIEFEVPASAVQPLPTLDEAELQEKATRLNYVSRPCPTCGGRLTFTVPDINSPGGKLTRDCDGCNRHGRVWYRRDLAPKGDYPSRGDPIVSPLRDEQLMDLAEPKE